MALLPAAHLDYHTIVLEEDQRLFIRKTPIQLINAACLENGSTYDGRRTSVMHQTGFKRKIPIPFKPSKGIYTFPSHSLTDLQCSWIFYKHIRKMIQYQSPERPTIKSIIIINNGKQLPMNVSHFTLEKQMQRTLTCIYMFSNLVG